MIIELPYYTRHLYFLERDHGSQLIFDLHRPTTLMEIKVLNFQSDDGH